MKGGDAQLMWSPKLHSIRECRPPRPLKILPGLNGASHPLNLGCHQESTQWPSCLSVCVIALLLQLLQELARVCVCKHACALVLSLQSCNIILQRLILLSWFTLKQPFDICYILFLCRTTLILTLRCLLMWFSARQKKLDWVDRIELFKEIFL